MSLMPIDGHKPAIKVGEVLSVDWLLVVLTAIAELKWQVKTRVYGTDTANGNGPQSLSVLML